MLALSVIRARRLSAYTNSCRSTYHKYFLYLSFLLWQMHMHPCSHVNHLTLCNHGLPAACQAPMAMEFSGKSQIGLPLPSLESSETGSGSISCTWQVVLPCPAHLEAPGKPLEFIIICPTLIMYHHNSSFLLIIATAFLPRSHLPYTFLVFFEYPYKYDSFQVSHTPMGNAFIK